MTTADFPEKLKSKNTRVTIYRNTNSLRPEGVEYKVTFYDAGGKRRFKSFDAYKDARAEATDILDRAKRGQMDTMDLERDDILAFQQAKELLSPHGLTVDLAVKEFVESLELLGGKHSVMEAVRYFAKKHPTRFPVKQVAEVRDELIEEKKAAGLSELYIADLRYRCGAFAEAFQCPIASVTKEDVKAFLKGLKLSARSRNNFGRTIMTLFEFAKERGYLPKDHDEVEFRKLKVKAVQEEIEIFTPEELGKLLANAPADFVPALAIGAFAGLRTAEIERLDWEQVGISDPEGQRFITVTAGNAKTGSRRIVPILPNLAAWLSPYVKPTGPVWPHSHPYMYECQHTVAERAKIKWKHNALRHSFISYRVAMTKDVNSVALESGNSSQMIFKHYRELVKPHQAQKWFSIEPGVMPNVVTLPAASAA